MEVKEETGEGMGGGAMEVEVKDEPPEETGFSGVLIRVKVEEAEEKESEEEYIFEDRLEDGGGGDPLGSEDEVNSDWSTRNVRLRPRRTSVRWAVSSGEESEAFGDGGDSDWVPEVKEEDSQEKGKNGKKGVPELIREQENRRREKDRLRMRLKRASLPPEEAALKRKRHAELQRAKRAALSPEERERRREMNRERMKLQRIKRLKGVSGTEDETSCGDVGVDSNLANMTPEEAEQYRRERDSARKRAKRASLTPEEKAALRRERNAEAARARRAAMTPEEKESNRKRHSERERARRQRLKELSVTGDESSCDYIKVDTSPTSPVEAGNAREKGEMTPEEAARRPEKDRLRKRWERANMAAELLALRRKRKAEWERAKRAALTPEEREREREVHRERERARRLKLKGMSGTEDKNTGVSLASSTSKRRKEKRKAKNSEKPAGKSLERAERRREKGRLRMRQKRASMTPEEAALKRKQQAEAARARRAALAPEEREKQRERDRERAKESRLRLKGLSGESEGELGAGDEDTSVNGKGRRAVLTQQQLKDRARQKVLDRITQRAAMTDEELEKRRQQDYFRYHAKLASMTPEEQKAKNKSLYARKVEKYGPEVLRERRQREWREMDPGKKESLLEQLRRNTKRKLARLKEDPEKYVEWRRIQTERNRQRKIKLGIPVRAPDWAEKHFPPRIPGVKESKEELEAQKKMRAELKKIRDRKWALTNRLEVLRMSLESGKSIDEVYQEHKTGQRRERRCISHRVRKARLKVQENLEAQGATKEEIARRLEEVELKSRSGVMPDGRKGRGISKRSKSCARPEDIAELEGKIAELDRLREQVEQGQKVNREAENRHSAKRKSLLTKAAPDLTVNTECIVKNKRTPQITQQTPRPPPPTAGPSSLAEVQTVNSTNQNGWINYVVAQENYLESSYAASASSSQHEDHYANGSNFDDDMPPSPGDNSDDGGFSENSFQSQTEVSQDKPNCRTETVVALYSGFTPQQLDTRQEPSDTSTSADPPRRARGRPRKGEVLEPRKPLYQPPKNPNAKRRTRRTDVVKDAICDQCGQAQTRENLRNHKHYYHNPHYDQPSKTCKLCGLSFAKDPLWYSHFLKEHLRESGKAAPKIKKLDPLRTAICDECGGAYNQENLKQHQKQMHNPNYDLVNRKCKICGESYAPAQVWYSHYVSVHVRPGKPAKGNRHVCELCGRSFLTLNNYNHHKYYVHGEGSKTENFLKCPLCPGEKLFKEKRLVRRHFKRTHPEAEYRELAQHVCGRCPDKFLNSQDLCKHLQEMHSESCFVCQYCKVCRFSQLGLHFHYASCPKIGKEERKRVEGKWTGDYFTVEGLPLKCELCEKQMKLTSLTGHYRVKHGVTEDRFECELCRRRFSGRYVWANHLEEMHGKTVEELGRFVNKLNAENREGLVCKPARGRKNRAKKLESEDEEEPLTKRRPKRVTVTKKRKRRKIVVICEEDEVEAAVKLEEEAVGSPGVKVESEVESSQEVDEESSWSESE